MLMLALVIAAAVLLALGALLTHWVAAQVEKAVPPQGRFIDVDGYRLHVVERGQGPAILCVHGLCGQIGNFQYLPLDRMAQTNRVVLVDRPGSGYSTRAPGAPPGLREQARVLAGLIRALGLEEPLVVGHSLGGAVALALALDHPADVAGLALIAPLTRYERRVPPLPFLALALPRFLRPLYAHCLAVPLVMLLGKPLVAGIFAPEDVPRDFRVKGGGLLGLRPGAYLEAARDVDDIFIDFEDVVARYPTLRLPIGLLYGRGDGVLSWRLNGEEFVKTVAHADLAVVDGGHMLPVTQPGDTAQWILRRAEWRRTVTA